jgi:hypothetical protein
LPDIEAIAQAHNYQPKKSRYYFYSSGILEYFPEDSMLLAFYVNGSVPSVFKEFLSKAIPPYVRHFHASAIDNPEEYMPIENRECRYRDFDMLISFVNNNKVTATKSGGYINKTALLKFHKIANYDEVCNNDSGEIGDIRNAGEAIVSFGIAQLLRCADVLDIVKESYVLSANAIKFAGMSMPEKAKFLYTAYIGHGNDIIDECARISAARLKFARLRYPLSGPREEVVSILRECPVGEWIDFNHFSKELRKTNRDIFDVVGKALKRDDYYNQYYDAPAWDDFERLAVSNILMEYLAVLGAVDVYTAYESYGDYDNRTGVEVAYFRVTDLGAYLFGMADAYAEKGGGGLSGADKGFLVQPNFDVVIPQGDERMKHELFFERFATKTTDDKAVSVYKLDFESMVQALYIGLRIHEISSYCEAFASAEIPENVKDAFEEWEAQSSRVRIRNVAIVETDDVFLLEEIKNYRGMGSLLEGGAKPVLILLPKNEKKAKKLIEKNKRFCVIKA